MASSFAPCETSTSATRQGWCGYLLNGLKKHIDTTLTDVHSLDLLILAAEEMNARFSLSAKQAPSADAVLPTSSSGGGYGPIRNIRGLPFFAVGTIPAPAARAGSTAVAEGLAGKESFASMSSAAGMSRSRVCMLGKETVTVSAVTGECAS